MRTLNCTIVIPDNDLIEHKARLQLENSFGYLGGESSYLKDIRKLPNTQHLLEDKSYLKLRKAEKRAKQAVWEYINKNHD